MVKKFVNNNNNGKSGTLPRSKNGNKSNQQNRFRRSNAGQRSNRVTALRQVNKRINKEISRQNHNYHPGSLASKDAGIYFMNVTDPRRSQILGGIPGPFPIKTCRTKLTLDGNFNANANGFYQLIFNPQNTQNMLVLFNAADLDNNMIQATTGTLVATMAGVLPLNMAVQYRIVGASLTTKCTGPKGYVQGYTMMASMMSGTVGLQQPAPGWTEITMKDQGIIREGKPTEELEGVYRPKDPSDLNFNNYSLVNPGRQAIVSTGFNLQNTESAVPAPIHWEINIIVEYIASITNYISEERISSADSRAIEMVGSFFAEMPHAVVAPPDKDSSWFDNTLSALSDFSQTVPGQVLGKAAVKLWDAVDPINLIAGLVF